jgi:hypothetical protein
MSHFQLNQEFFDKPIGLTETEIKEPLKVVESFFADYRLSELRRIQGEIQEVCLTTEIAPFSQAEGRSNLIYYNKKLICLLEAASQLKETVIPAMPVPKTETTIGSSNPAINHDIRISDVVKGINDAAVDVARLCVIVVNAWTANLCAEMKIPAPKTEKIAPPPMSPVDLDKLRSMALTLQSKLAKLSGIVIDILINEPNIRHS